MPAGAQLPDVALQFVPPLTARGRWDKERSVGQHLPYLAQIDPHTMLFGDGRLMQVIALDGLLFETAETGELNYRTGLRDAMLRAVGSSRFAIYHHIVRTPVDASLHGEFPDAFSEQIDQRWRDRLGAKQLFVNRLYLSLIRRPLQGHGGVAERVARVFGFGNRGADTLAFERSELTAASDALQAALSQYGPRLLGTYDLDGRMCSEALEFLSLLLNGERRPVVLPEGDLSAYLPYRRISFGAQAVELGETGASPRQFCGIVAIKEYPGQTGPGMLDDLLRLPAEMMITQSFGFADRQATLGRINLALRRMRAADDEAVSLRGELDQARDDVAAGRAAYGEHHMTVMVRAASAAQVDAGVAEVQAMLADLGLISVREEMALEPAFWAQFPGNFSYVARKGLVSSRNFASLASLHAFPQGQASGNHWGDAVTVFETSAAGPYHFNFHHGDLGNFTIIGPSGSGKTVVINFLLAQARRFDPRIVFFDKDRGAELFIRAIGGRYDVLRPGIHSGLNPLLLDDTPDNRRFLIDWVTRLLSLAGPALTPSEAARIKDAIDASMVSPRAYRRIGHFAQLLRGEQRPHAADLASRLAPWWGEGERAWLFDNAEDELDLAERVVGFDMTRILDDPIARTPAMMYLFHRVEQRLDGTPAIIVVDEGWKALDDEVFTSRIRDWEKTIRKRNGIVGFATQSAEDALSSRIASAIVEQAATQIFMPNPKAQEDHYVKGFGLTRHEFDLVRGLPDTAHAFLVKHANESVVVRLDLSGERDMLTVLSGRERTVRRLDELRARVGDDPGDWLPPLLEAAE